MSQNHFIAVCDVLLTYSNLSMSDPFVDDQLSQINEAETLYSSRFSSMLEKEQENWYQDNRNFARSMLSNWGIPIGELPYNSDNEITLRSLVELIELRQKDIQFRGRAKDEMNALQFQREKYRSYMQQGQRAVEQHLKQIGRLENENTVLKAMLKKSEAVFKRQRDQDRKMIAMLRNKNQQILHEVKKREQEAHRLKEHLKKTTSEKTQIRNTFEVYQNLASRSPYKNGGDADKYEFLLQRNDRELAQAMRENSLLREKLFDIRESLVNFNKWIDGEIFGQSTEESRAEKVYGSKFYLNHNLLFKKESLADELENLVTVTKNGLTELREICRGNKSPPKLQATELKLAEGLSFKKKDSVRKQIQTDRTKRQGSSFRDERALKNIKMTTSKKFEPSNTENETPHLKASISNNAKSKINTKPTLKSKPPSTQTKMTKSVTQTMPVITSKGSIQSLQSPGLPPFEDELLSEVDAHNSSIVSHISIEHLGKSRTERWNILYQEDEL